MMTPKEQAVIRNIIKRIQAGPDTNAAEEIKKTLNEPGMKIFMDTWVIGALERLLPEKRNVKAALSLSQ